ncbi:MAG: amidohydrolase family protein [Pseudomonadota bacterium]
MIIDSHCHAGAGDGLTGPWDTRAALGAYMRHARAAGIRRTVIFPAFHSDYRLANRRVGQLVRRHPDRLSGYAFVHAERDKGRIDDMIREAKQRYQACGIKVHRYDARITREVCETARRHQLPVLYDVLGEVAGVELIASEYPDVAFIIPHLGSFADAWDKQTAFLPYLTRFPNVYTDSSGVRRHDLLRRVIDEAGPSKLLFGSDGPWLHPAVELAKIHALELDRNAERMVLGGNWQRLVP